MSAPRSRLLRRLLYAARTANRRYALARDCLGPYESGTDATAYAASLEALAEAAWRDYDDARGAS